jgi:hypothetical protein
MAINEKAEKSCSTFVDCLCDIMLQKDMLKKDDIISLKKDFHESSIPLFEDFLMQEGLIEKEDLLQALSIFYKTQAVDVTGFFFDHHLVTMFPKDEMLRNMFIPYEHDIENDDVLTIVAANPHNADLAAIVGKYVSYDVIFFVGIANDIDDAIKEYFDKPLYEVEPDIIDAEEARREEHPVDTMIYDLMADETHEGND